MVECNYPKLVLIIIIASLKILKSRLNGTNVLCCTIKASANDLNFYEFFLADPYFVQMFIKSR